MNISANAYRHRLPAILKAPHHINSAMNIVQSMKLRFYRGVVRTIARRFGLNEVGRQILWTYIEKFGNPIRVEIGPGAGTFDVATWEEYSVLNNALETERPIIAAMAEVTEPTDTIWDVGANIGTYTVLLGSDLSTGEVVSVEPYPANATRLRTHITANATPATVTEVALGDEHGTAELAILYSENSGTQQHSYASEYIDRDQQVATCEVPLTTGDELIASGVPSPDIVKIDVEGAGIRVLNGFEGALRAGRCRALFIEPHENRDALLAILDEHDYLTESIECEGFRRDDEPFIFARSN